MNRVVKCKNNQCEQHFMHTEKSTKCPFCRTEYGEEEKPKEKEVVDIEEKKEAKKTKKESFKIWKDL